MSEKQGVSIKLAILYGLAIIVVAFIGVLLGSWFVEWRQARNAPKMPDLSDWQEHNPTLFSAGDRFPDEELLDMDSNAVHLDSVIAGKKALVLFMSPGCEPCTMLINAWKKNMNSKPADLFVIGIAGGEFAELKAYQTEKEIPFLVFSDPLMLYTQQHEIIGFPTIVGLNEDGQVTLVWQGFNPKYSLTDYYNTMVSFDTPQEKKELQS